MMWLNCLTCGGSGHTSQCNYCKGITRVPCKKCHGAGKVEGVWLKSLRKLSPDRLMFEYQRRQQKIQAIYTQLNRLSRELEEDYEDEVRDRARDPSFYRGAGPTIFVNEGKIERLESEVHKIEEEMTVIEKVLAEV